jgi:hypothetical protein
MNELTVVWFMRMDETMIEQTTYQPARTRCTLRSILMLTFLGNASSGRGRVTTARGGLVAGSRFVAERHAQVMLKSRWYVIRDTEKVWERNEKVIEFLPTRGESLSTTMYLVFVRVRECLADENSSWNDFRRGENELKDQD